MPAAEHSTHALRRILGRGSVYTIGSGLQLGAAVLVLPALTRLLDPAEFGLVAAAMVITTLLTIIATGGLPASIMRTFFREEGGPAGSRSLVLLTLLTAIAVALLAYLTGPLWSKMFSGIPYGAPLRIATWSAVALAGLRAVQSVLRAAERAGAFVTTVAFSSIVAQGLGLLAATRWGATGYLGGLAVGFFLALGAGLSLLREWPIRLPSRALARRAFAVGLPTVPHGLAFYIMSAGDRVIIERLDGLIAVGRYQLAYAIGSIGFVILNALSLAWTPVLFRASEESRWPLLSDTSAAIAWLAALLAGILAAGAPLALDLIAPVDYELEPLVPVSAFVAASLVPWVIFFAASQALIWIGRTGALAVSTIGAAAANVGLNLVLIPAWGLVGAAVATLIAYVLLAVTVTAWTRRLVTIPWRRRQLLGALALAGALVAIAAIEPTGDAWTWIRGAEVAALLAAAAYVGSRVTAAGAALQRRLGVARSA